MLADLNGWEIVGIMVIVLILFNGRRWGGSGGGYGHTGAVLIEPALEKKKAAPLEVDRFTDSRA